MPETLGLRPGVMLPLFPALPPCCRWRGTFCSASSASRAASLHPGSYRLSGHAGSYTECACRLICLIPGAAVLAACIKAAKARLCCVLHCASRVPAGKGGLAFNLDTLLPLICAVALLAGGVRPSAWTWRMRILLLLAQIPNCTLRCVCSGLQQGPLLDSSCLVPAGSS